jgi:hypothetical protein
MMVDLIVYAIKCFDGRPREDDERLSKRQSLRISAMKGVIQLQENQESS